MQSEGGSGRLSGTVKMVMPLGPQVIYDVELPGWRGRQNQPAARGRQRIDYASGSTVHFAPVSPSACHVFPVKMLPR